MLIEIVKRTPLWVFFLFFVLLAIGYMQSKDRAVRLGTVTILPVAMISLSFYGVISAFGIAPAGLFLWISGVTIVLGLGIKIASPANVTFSADTQSFLVPGSWLPLALMMAIFMLKYTVGVILARQLPIAKELVFIGFVSFCYGLLSGVFLARATVILRAKTRLRA